jgi:hypothetical protein
MGKTGGGRGTNQHQVRGVSKAKGAAASRKPSVPDDGHQGHPKTSERDPMAANPQTLHWYQYRSPRSFGIGCQPAGHASFDDEVGRYGAVSYNRELDAAEVYAYELIPMEDATV